VETLPKPPISPLGDVPVDPRVAALPKVDLHIHQEVSPRLDRVLTFREGRAPYDWRGWAARVIAENPPGEARLQHFGSVQPVSMDQDAIDENFAARVEVLLEEAAADGAILVEVRFGNETLLRPNLMELFRLAERRVRGRYPDFHAEAAATLLLWIDPAQLERIVRACIRLAAEGLGGIDLLYQPYATEADWTSAYRIAETVAEAGLGVTAHAGEVSTAKLVAALRVPGLTRIGHATHAAADPRLLELLATSGVTVECCLTCNVVVGAAPSYEEHPVRRFTERGFPSPWEATTPSRSAPPSAGSTRWRRPSASRCPNCLALRGMRCRRRFSLPVAGQHCWRSCARSRSGACGGEGESRANRSGTAVHRTIRSRRQADRLQEDMAAR
jgi:adenosine deaminase